jgi:hypothetical protein
MQLGAAARGAHVVAHALGVGIGDDAVGDERGEGFVEVEPAVQAERRSGIRCKRAGAGHHDASGASPLY